MTTYILLTEACAELAGMKITRLIRKHGVNSRTLPLMNGLVPMMTRRFATDVGIALNATEDMGIYHLLEILCVTRADTFDLSRIFS
jgi:hypothetical protein